MTQFQRLMTVIVGYFGAACASVSGPKAPAARFDPSLYVKAQEPELAQLDPALRGCVEGAPVSVNWHVAGDGHVEDVSIAEPPTPSVKEHNCILAAAYKANFAAPANGKKVVVSHSVAPAPAPVIAGEMRM